MIGILAFIADTGFTVAIPISAIAAVVNWWRHKRLLSAVYTAVGLLAFAVIAEPLLVSRYYSKLTNYLLLRRLEHESVISISIGTTTWSKREAIQVLVNVLHQPSWVLRRGDIGRSGPPESITVALASGETIRLCIGRHYYGGGPFRDEAIVKYSYSGSDCSAGDEFALIPGLPSMLEGMSHSLPK
jgi:hypothetical protein